MKEQGKLKNVDGTKGVRLIYVDSSFATKQKFRGKNVERLIMDKIIGAQFFECLREADFSEGVLTGDVSIYGHLDWEKRITVKVFMGEIFGENNFLNEVFWY